MPGSVTAGAQRGGGGNPLPPAPHRRRRRPAPAAGGRRGSGVNGLLLGAVAVAAALGLAGRPVAGAAQNSIGEFPPSRRRRRGRGTAGTDGRTPRAGRSVPCAGCGSAIKIANRNGARLHTGEITYGSGSGQQAVTGLLQPHHAGSYWQILGETDGACPQGTPVQKGQRVRLWNPSTAKVRPWPVPSQPCTRPVALDWAPRSRAFG